jgi:hypothetical protein
MAYHDDLQAALKQALPGMLVFMKDWSVQRRVRWAGPAKRPVGLFLHHTAAAATTSTSASDPGNKKGANNGVINFIQNHYEVPAASFTLDRDGTVYVHAAYPIWHAGLGSFKGKQPWSQWNCPDNMANDWFLGVEIMSEGQKKDFTLAQKKNLVALLKACASVSPDWQPEWLKNRPRHKDWTTRKIDILYTNDEVKDWIVKYGQ